MSAHLKIQKTIKLFIDGKFPRTESGRSYPQYASDGKTIYANLCQASRKDLRSAVEASEKAGSSWRKMTAYNRSQILYRMAEMLEGKRTEFSVLFQDVMGLSLDESNQEIDQAIDTLVHFSGWADKYQQVVSTLNPVASPHHSFTSAEAIGVTVLVASDHFSLSKLLSDISSIILSGNSVIVLLGTECPSVLAPLAEVFATSDLPGGVVNLLTGNLAELHEHIGSHMEIRAVSYQNENRDLYESICKLGVENMKRIIPPFQDDKGLAPISKFVEFKTIWHPIGQ